MRNPHLARRSAFLLVALKGCGCCQDGPAMLALQPQDAPAKSHLRLEDEPCNGDTVSFPRLSFDTEMAWFHLVQGCGKEGGDLVLSLHGFDIPGEGDHVAPEAFAFVKQVEGGGQGSGRESLLQLVQPACHALVCSTDHGVPLKF